MRFLKQITDFLFRALFVFSLTFSLTHCQPVTLLSYELKTPEDSTKRNDWSLTPFYHGTSILAEHCKDGIETQVIITRKTALEEVAFRMTERKESGAIDVVPVRVSVFNTGRRPLNIDFSKIRIAKVNSKQSIEPINIRGYHLYADQSRLPFEWTFGQRSSFLFQQGLPDYVRFAEIDSASEDEHAAREEKRMKNFRPISGTRIDPGVRMIGWYIFPLLDTDADYRFEMPPESLPPFEFKVLMVKKADEIFSFDDPDEEINKRLQADREEIFSDNQDLFTMHHQIRKHAELLQAEASKSSAPR